MKNCWEIKNCGRQKGGQNELELGICVAAQGGLGHSCWAVAGTLCGGKVQGTVAKKEAQCIKCEVYVLYNRLNEIYGKRVGHEFPKEQKKYRELLMDRLKQEQGKVKHENV